MCAREGDSEFSNRKCLCFPVFDSKDDAGTGLQPTTHACQRLWYDLRPGVWARRSPKCLSGHGTVEPTHWIFRLTCELYACVWSADWLCSLSIVPSPSVYRCRVPVWVCATHIKHYTAVPLFCVEHFLNFTIYVLIFQSINILITYSFIRTFF